MLSDLDRAYCPGYSREKERQDFFSVFKRAFVQWEDGTLSLDVNIQIRQTDPHKSGALGFSVLWIWAIYGSVFQFWH